MPNANKPLIDSVGDGEYASVTEDDMQTRHHCCTQLTSRIAPADKHTILCLCDLLTATLSGVSANEPV